MSFPRSAASATSLLQGKGRICQKQRQGQTVSSLGRAFPFRRWFLVLLVLSCGRMSAAEAGDAQITLTIPLEQGTRYSRRRLHEECHRQLGTPLFSEEREDQLIELTVAEKGALLLAKQAGLLDVCFESDHLTISLPDPEDEEVRREQRQRLERLFGISLSAWPEGKGLHVPELYHPQQQTILLVHGLEGSQGDLQRLVEACHTRGWQTLQFDYPNTGPIAWAGERLRQELQQFSGRFPAARVVAIAHSMGGLVVRWCLEAPGEAPGGVTDVIFLGTPHQGSVLAGESDLLGLFDKPVYSRERLQQVLQDGLGEARVDLTPQSAFLRRLNAFPRPRDVRYHVGIGTKSFLSAEQTTRLHDVLRQRLADPDLSPKLRARWQPLIAAAELVPGQGDGAVSLGSAHLGDVASERTFALHHLDLIRLPEDRPEESDVFQWIVNVVDHPAAREQMR